ncbi:hypothetical protein ACT7C8_01565 [Bacillus cereus]
MKQSIQQQVLQADTPPTKYDWRNVNGENFITPIKDQKIVVLASLLGRLQH